MQIAAVAGLLGRLYSVSLCAARDSEAGEVKAEDLSG